MTAKPNAAVRPSSNRELPRRKLRRAVGNDRALRSLNGVLRHMTTGALEGMHARLLPIAIDHAESVRVVERARRRSNAEWDRARREARQAMLAEIRALLGANWSNEALEYLLTSLRNRCPSGVPVRTATKTARAPRVGKGTAAKRRTA